MDEIEALARKLCKEDGRDPDSDMPGLYRPAFCRPFCWEMYREEAARILADENRLTSPPE